MQVRVDRSRETVRYARAGHLPPLLVTAAGEASLLEEGGAPPLAAVEPPTAHPRIEVPFPPRATLVLYTDGLVERRGRPIDEGVSALAEVVRRHLALDVEQLADAILDELRAEDTAPDDTALVIARSTT